MNSLLEKPEAVQTESRNERHCREKQRRTRNATGVSALMYAAQQGDVNIVKNIIGVEGSSLLQRDRTGKTALHYSSTSCSRCASQAADLMVMAAPELVDGRDEDGFTPLHLAVIAGNMQLVTFLLANGADVNAVDNEKHTVVHWAAVCGETVALRSVLAAGAHVSTPDVHGGYPLHYAAQMCGGERDPNLGLQVLQTLLSHSEINVSVTDVDKREPLLWAASAGSAKAVLALIRAGANVEASDKDGLTALHCAASRGHTDCMDTLLTLCGASVDIIDTNGCTALHYAVTLGHADATALLLAHGADPNRQDRKGRSPSHCGCAKGQFETVKLIGSHGANLWLRNARGDFPLHDAAASGRRDLVKWLLEIRPSQVNARNNDGRCPLHMAALNDNTDMCKILLDGGAQINPVLRTSKNVFMTPLDCALQRGYRSTAKYLQVHGGVPATRLSDPGYQPINSALNLQIKDDVTFYDETSSGSEKDYVQINKRKKVSRRRVPHIRQEKKYISVSGSEKSDSEKVKLLKQKSTEKSAAKGDDRRKSSSRIDYSNEITINGKTEVNISQSSEILLDRESVQTQTSAKFTEKDRRPRSAKYGRLRDKSAQSSLNKETMISISSQASVSKIDHSTSTSGDISDLKKEINTNLLKESNLPEKKDLIENKKTSAVPLQDQHSVMSFTSEDVEEPKKEIVVEASVHPQPQELELKKEMKNTFNNNNTESNTNIAVKAEKINEKESVNITDETKKAEKDFTELTSRDISNHSDKLDNTKLEIICKEPKDNEINKTEEKQLKYEPIDLLNKEYKELLEEKKLNNYVKIDNETQPETGDFELISQDKINTNYTQPEISVVIEEKMQDKVDIKENSDIDVKEEKEETSSNKIEHIFKETSEVILDSTTEDQKQTDLTVNLKTPITDQEISEVSKENIENYDKILLDEKQDNNKVTKTKSTEKSTDKKKHKDKVKENGKTHDRTKRNGIKNGINYKTNKSHKHQDNDSKDLSGLSSFSDDDEFLDKTHRSFRVLNDKESGELDDTKRKRFRQKKDPSMDESRSRSLETKIKKDTKRSKIPTPLFKSTLSKSDRHLNESYKETNLDARIPSLPNIRDEKNALREPARCDSNMSAPLLTSVLSDKDKDSISELEDNIRNVTKNKRFVKRRSKNREARSAGSDYESSNLIDSGFEPSPRSTRVPKWKNMSDRGVNMTSVTQSIQTSIRRYHLERKIFQQLLELKRHQIRAGQHNEAILVKRAIDAYHKSCASTVGVGRYLADDYTFKSFEKFLYEALRKLQKNGAEYMRGLPETSANPLLCTKSTNRCMHAAHAYTGVPCAAYLPKMDHHSIPKIGYNSVECKPGTGGFLPTINKKKAVTLELTHGNDKQVISLPTNKLDQNKRYYVTFTVKGHEAPPSDADSLSNNNVSAHKHSKSD